MADSFFRLKVNLLVAEVAVVVKWLFPTSTLFLRVAEVRFPRRVPSLAGR